MQERRSPLHEEHLRSGGRMVEFGGWVLPVQFRSILEEHKAVRETAGLFDISHMGRVEVTGPGASRWLDGLLTNNVSNLAPGAGHYTFLLNETGGVIDDLILYRTANEEFLMIVNAARTDEDLAWMRAHADPGASWRLLADGVGMALQGPAAPAIFREVFSGAEPPARNRIAPFPFAGEQVWVAGTGYTGELGCEIFAPVESGIALWRALLEQGAAHGLVPAGLGARDTLRLEMAYPLNGSDLSPARTPLEAGLGAFVDLAKPGFIGADALLVQKSFGAKEQRLAGIVTRGKPVPLRAHYGVWRDGEQIGELTSGTLSPTLGAGIGMAYLPADAATPGTELEIDIRGRKYPAVTVKKPFLKQA
jgi:aminomethyltransferase